MDQQQVPGRRIGLGNWGSGAEGCHATDRPASIGRGDLPVQEPLAAGGGATSLDALERRLAPVVVVARDGIERRPEAAQQRHGLRHRLAFLDKIPRETNEIGPQTVNPIHNRLEIGPISLVVEVGEVDQAQPWCALP